MRLPIEAVRQHEITETMWAHVTEGVNYIQVHPTFLYESMWNMVLLCLLLLYWKHKKFEGEIAILYFGGYGLGRCMIEGLRTDQLLLPHTNLAVSQILAGILVVFAIVVEVSVRTKKTQV